jgi:DNA excision repair protein ERCC-2
MQFCNVIIYSYHYLLDPKIAERVSRELSGDCIVVLDEAHNIDNVCTESLSSDINDDALTRATRSAEKIGRKVDEMEETDCDKLENEYRNLVKGLIDVSEQHQDNDVLANPGNYIDGKPFVSR